MKVTDEELIPYLESQGYRELRRINGVLCGLLDYVTTRSITVGLDGWTFERRYCYQNRIEADAAFAVYTDPDKHPGGMWIKLKGEYRGEFVDAMNPNFSDLQPWDVVAPSDEEKK